MEIEIISTLIFYLYIDVAILSSYSRSSITVPGTIRGSSNVEDGGGFSSSSIEVYIPIIENATNGTLVLDGSYGYIGKVETPFKITFEDGKIVDIENSKSGKILKDYLESFDIYFITDI